MRKSERSGKLKTKAGAVPGEIEIEIRLIIVETPGRIPYLGKNIA